MRGTFLLAALVAPAILNLQSSALPTDVISPRSTVSSPEVDLAFVKRGFFSKGPLLTEAQQHEIAKERVLLRTDKGLKAEHVLKLSPADREKYLGEKIARLSERQQKELVSTLYKMAVKQSKDRALGLKNMQTDGPLEGRYENAHWKLQRDQEELIDIASSLSTHPSLVDNHRYIQRSQEAIEHYSRLAALIHDHANEQIKKHITGSIEQGKKSSTSVIKSWEDKIAKAQRIQDMQNIRLTTQREMDHVNKLRATRLAQEDEARRKIAERKMEQEKQNRLKAERKEEVRRQEAAKKEEARRVKLEKQQAAINETTGSSPKKSWFSSSIFKTSGNSKRKTGETSMVGSPNSSEMNDMHLTSPFSSPERASSRSEDVLPISRPPTLERVDENEELPEEVP